jgi:hypothetical protein
LAHPIILEYRQGNGQNQLPDTFPTKEYHYGSFGILR